MKLRLLNGSHSTLAYLGFLSGHEFIWQASADPLLATLVERLMAEEVMPTLVAPPGVDLPAYGAQLMQRFRNPALPHRTQQIAMDGSQKLPQRLLATVRERLAGGGSIAHLALAIAGWIRYASGVDEHGKPIAVSDPLAAKFAALAAAARGNAAHIADGFLDLAEVFGADLTGQCRFPPGGEPRRRRAVPRRRPQDARGAHRAARRLRRDHDRIAADPASGSAVSRRSGDARAWRAPSTRRSRTCRS